MLEAPCGLGAEQDPPRWQETADSGREQRVDMEPPKRTRLSDGINFDRSLDALPENIEMKKILSCLSELSSANENSMRTTELLQVYRSSNLDGDSKCFSPEAIHAMAEHQEKLRGLLGLVSSKLKLILPFQNQVRNLRIHFKCYFGMITRLIP